MKKLWTKFFPSKDELLLKLFLPSKKSLKQLHYALFDFFLPYEGDNPKLLKAIQQVREEQFELLMKNIPVKWILAIIYKPKRLLSNSWINSYYKYAEKTEVPSAVIQTAKKELKAYLDKLGKYSLLDMNYEEKLGFLNILVNADINFYRRIGAGLRVYYFLNVYRGEVGRLISDTGNFKGDAFVADPEIEVPEFTTHLRYNASKKAIEGELDYIIIGAGPSGCLVASQLHKAGKKVAIVEAGSFFMPGTFDGRAGLHFYEDSGFRTSQDGGVFVLNGSAVGGGATVNVDMAFEPSIASIRSRFDLWRSKNYIDDQFWSPEQLQKAHAQVSSQFNTREVEPHEVNIHNNILKEGSELHGLSTSYYRLNTYKPGASPYKRTDKIGPVEQYIIEPMQDRENPLSLIADADVSEIVIKNGKATGLRFKAKTAKALKGVVEDIYGLNLPKGESISIAAKNIIVAGGNLGSSTLLQRSGLKNEMIGKGFVMHPFVLVLGLFDKKVDNHLGTQSSIYVGDYLTTNHLEPKADFLLESASARPEIGAMLMPGSPKQVLNTIGKYRYIGGFGVLLIEEMQKQNRIEVDKDGKPEVYYKLSDDDISRFRYGVAEAIKIMFKGGAKKVIIPSFERLSGDPSADWGCNVIDHIDQAEEIADKLKFRSNETLMFAAHMMAGVKMSQDPKMGCIGQDYRVHGTENIFVVDSSIFPSSVGANPMETIYTTAQVFIDTHLKKEVLSQQPPKTSTYG